MTNMLDHVVAAAQGWHVRQLKYRELVPPHLWDRDADPEKLTDTWAWFDEKEKLQRFERTYSPSTVIGLAMELMKSTDVWALVKLPTNQWEIQLPPSMKFLYAKTPEVVICYGYLQKEGRM